MKILVVSPYPILPPLHGGRVRTARLAEAMARAGASVDVLCPWYPGQPRDGSVANAFTCHSHFLATNVLPWMFPWLAAPLTLLSFQPPPRRRLHTFASYDVFQFEFCAHARWMYAVPQRARVVYSAHNVELDFCRDDARRYLCSRFSLRRVECLERLAVRRSDLVVTCSEEDRARLQALYGGPCMTVVPNGCPQALLDLDRGRLRAISRTAVGFGPDERVILFIGGDASHNRESVEFLLTAVLPELDRQWHLLIVGRCGRAARTSIDNRARSIGFVDDLRPYFAAADVAVEPVLRGSGSSVKLREYLAAGLAVVSTPVGVRGFAERPSGVHVAPRERFAEALRGSLTPPVPDRAALRRLTWESLGDALLREYEALCVS